MNKYRINKNTLAILPMENGNSLIYEVNKVLVINKNSFSIIKNNILMDGSTYEGRIKIVKDLTGYNYKSPILVDCKNNIVFFPTCSPRLKIVAWINIDSIKNIDFDNKNNLSIIKLINGNSIKINISFYALNKQVLRASRYKHLLRKNEV